MLFSALFFCFNEKAILHDPSLPEGVPGSIDLAQACHFSISPVWVGPAVCCNLTGRVGVAKLDFTIP